MGVGTRQAIETEKADCGSDRVLGVARSRDGSESSQDERQKEMAGITVKATRGGHEDCGRGQIKQNDHMLMWFRWSAKVKIVTLVYNRRIRRSVSGSRSVETHGCDEKFTTYSFTKTPVIADGRP